MAPRAFDSDTAAGDSPLRFTENVDCPSCDAVFVGEFVGDADTVQDLVETPTGEHVCPRCGYEFTSPITGWMFYGEAG